jgi:deoxycytidylate deaminase
MSRPSRETIHMQSALAWGRRSMCSQPNRQIGAIITSFDMRRVLAIGYNGPGRDMPDNFCQSWRIEQTKLRPVQISEDEVVAMPGPVVCDGTVSSCPCLHAEDNAIAFVDSTVPDKRLFVSMQPCLICAQRIMNANIRHVYFKDEYRDCSGIQALQEAKIKVYRFEDPDCRSYSAM